MNGRKLFRHIEIAKATDVLTFLDTSGDALHKGLAAEPFFVKPNEAEVKSLLDVKQNGSFDFAQAAVEISTNYKTNVLLSMGAKGAIAAHGQEAFVVQNPIVDAMSAVGSGDCMLAGLTHGILHGFSFEESILYGVAAGTANTLTIGAGHFKLEDFERLRGQVCII